MFRLDSFIEGMQGSACVEQFMIHNLLYAALDCPKPVVMISLSLLVLRLLTAVPSHEANEVLVLDPSSLVVFIFCHPIID